jgi:hypothetical protein
VIHASEHIGNRNHPEQGSGAGRRQILWLGVTAHPTAEWIAGARRRATWRASSARTTTSTAGRRTLTTPMPVLLTAATSFVLLVNSAGRDARSRRPKGEQLWRYLTRRHKRRRPRRSRGAVLYLLFIICANPKPAVRNLAMKLARHAVQLSRAQSGDEMAGRSDIEWTEDVLDQ